MKQRQVSIVSLFVVLFSAMTAASTRESVSFSYPVTPKLLDGRIVQPAASSRLTIPGGYDLPMDQKTVRFPAGTVCESVRVVRMDRQRDTLLQELSHVEKKRISNQVINAPDMPGPLEGSGYYPSHWYDIELRQGLDPVTMEPTLFVTCRVYPVRVDGTSIQYLTGLILEITATVPTDVRKRDDAALFIVAPQVFMAELTPFISHKQALGISTQARSVEDIDAVESGRDLQEKIKYAIERAYVESSSRYILLAGDAAQIPVRYGCNFDYGDMGLFEFVPADIYYADLYDYRGSFCDWDANGNDLFGEFEFGLGNPDRCDFFPDVMLGRIPANSTSELSGALKKIMDYETNITGTEEWIGRAVLAAADTFCEATGSTESSGIPEGEYLKERIAADYLSDWELVKLYETDIYPRNYKLTAENLVSVFNAGAGFVNFAYHGASTGWPLPDGFFGNDSVPSLTNADKLPVVMAHACSTAQFDFENNQCPEHGYADKCFGETMLLHPTGGCLAYFGSTRGAMAGGWGMGDNTGALGLVDYAFFEGVNMDYTTLGRIHQHAVSTLLIQRGTADFEEFLTMLEFICLGDPSVSSTGRHAEPNFELVWKGFDDTAGDGDGCLEPGETADLMMDLANDGAPETGLSAELTVNDPSVVLLTSSVSLPDFPRGFRYRMNPAFRLQVAAGSDTDRLIPVQITLSGDTTIRKFQRDIFIGEHPGLITDHIVITSDDNSDNLAGQGENIQFAPALRNIGCATAAGVIGDILIEDEYIMEYGVLGSGEIPQIEPGETRTPTQLFYAKIDPETPHYHTFTCDITLTLSTTGQIWSFDLPMTVIDSGKPNIGDITIQPSSPEPSARVTVSARITDGAGVAAASLFLNSFAMDTSPEYVLYDDGAHDDGAPGDGVFGTAFDVIDTPTYFSMDFYTRDNLGNSGTDRSLKKFATLSFEENDNILLVSCAEEDMYLGYYTQALTDAGYGYDLWSWWRGTPSLDVLSRYRDGAVIWFYSHTFPILDQPARNVISDYLDLGGNLLLTEQDAGYSLFEMGTSETMEWYRNVLGAEYREDDSTIHSIIGVSGDPVTDGLNFNIDYGSSALNQFWPSLIDPLPAAQGCYYYKDYSGPYSGCAGVRLERADSRLIYMAFGFEGIASQKDRRNVMQQALEWFGVSHETGISPWDQSPGWWMGPDLLPLNARISTSVYFDPDRRIYHIGGLVTVGDPAGTGREMDPSIYYIDTDTGAVGDTGYDIEIARYHQACATLESADGPWIYFISGRDLNMNLVRETERFNPLTGQVQRLDDDPLPESIQDIPIAWVAENNKIYLIGFKMGEMPFCDNRTWVFDPKAPSGSRWQNMNAPMNHLRGTTCAAALNDTLYVFGGNISQETGGGMRIYSMEKLDLTADTPQWQAVADTMPSDFTGSQAIGIPSGMNVSLSGRILLAGTDNPDGRSTWIYDPDADSWSTGFTNNCSRNIMSPLLLIPSPRGGEIWTTHSYFYVPSNEYIRLYRNTEILRLGDSHRENWIGIRTNQDCLTGGCTLTVSLDIAGDDDATPVDCYVAIETGGVFFFLMAEPAFPTMTPDPAPLFTDVPLPVTTCYSGPLMSIPLPTDMSPLTCTFYAATLVSGTAELAGGLAWATVTVE